MSEFDDVIQIMQTDAIAMRDHHRTDASDVHAMLSVRIWRALRALGVANGRMLVTGVDTHEFARLPREHVNEWHQSENAGVLWADIPEERPGSGRARTSTTPSSSTTTPDSGGYAATFDVVIHNAPLADVTLHSLERRGDVQQEQGMNLLIHLTRTAPGGYLVAMLSRDVLDDPQAATREALTALGDVLGVVRLPDGALRNVAGCDNPTDMLLVRRRADHEPPMDHTAFLRTAAFIHTPNGEIREPRIETTADAQATEYLNESFIKSPLGTLLGTIDAREMPWGPARLSIRPSDRDLRDDVADALTQIVRSARREGLTAGPGTHSGPDHADPDHRPLPQRPPTPSSDPGIDL